MKAKLIFSPIAIAAVLTAHAALADTAPHWSHDEQDAPGGWGAIEDAAQLAPFNYPYGECAIGKHQSPVDLAGEVNEKHYDRLNVHYPQDTPDFFNSGHAVQVNTSAGYRGRLTIGNEVYPLTQFHFHAPAEHVIGAKTFDAELHFVHVREDGRIAVLGVLLEKGEANPEIDTVLKNVPAMADSKNTEKKNAISLKSLLPHDRKNFYTYAGSLTTPPCSEGVSWFVLAKPITVSTDQLTQLKGFFPDLYDGSHKENPMVPYMHGNARFIQSLDPDPVGKNTRIVTGHISQ